MLMKITKVGEKELICEEIWNLTRSMLSAEYPFFRTLFWHFEFQADKNVKKAGTDGKMIYYDPDFLIELYQKDSKEVCYLWLHMLYHCLFLHVINEPKGDQRLWNLACDMAAERLMARGIKNRTRSREEFWPDEIYKELQTLMGQEDKVQKLERKYVRDDHMCWQKADQMPILELMKNQWDQIQKHSGAGIGGISDSVGSQIGSKKERLRLQRSGKHDFQAFLKRFAVSGEEMETDTESFDYIPYLYGMDYYGNMPLIEHLEYKEVKKLEELVIAIDTSGSCSADMVRRFMEETYKILSNHENFFRKMNVYILQCDCAVQHVAHITSEDAWKAYLADLVIHGRSGTDFRPAFRYVEELREKKELKNLRGLLYFTDGDGIYPGESPDYETAFVFYHEKSEHQKVPSWAIQLTLEDET